MKRVNRSEPIILPSLPNYLKTDSGATIPIEAVTDSGLRELGRLWTLALIRIARNKRKKAREPGERKEGE